MSSDQTGEAVTLDLRTLQHRIEDLPSDVSGHVRMGYDLLTRASAEKRSQLYERMISAIQRGEVLERKEGANLLGMSDKIVGDALAAISLSASMIIDLKITADEFVAAAEGRLFPREAASVAMELARSIEQSRDELKRGTDEADIANSVLPSFRRLSYEIDLRLRFSDDLKVTTKVPVAVFYLRTDVTDDVWFQATETHLVAMQEKIESALKKIRSIRAGM